MAISSVLVVDDEPDIRMISELALQSIGGWETVVAGGGQEALEAAAMHQPDVILLDVMMPGMDGPTTLLKLRENEATANIPVIFLTARTQRRDVDRYLGLGAIAVIGKPFDPMTLAEEIAKAVAGSQAT